MRLVASSYPFLDVMWTMLVFFIWIAWFMLLFRVFADIFSRHDIGGWGKTGWSVFVICLPFLGVFVYLIAESKGMNERALAKAQARSSSSTTTCARRLRPAAPPPRSSGRRASSTAA